MAKTIMTIPQQLKKARQDAGLSQFTLSERIGIDVTNISKYENGVQPCHNPTLDVLQKWANATNTKIIIMSMNNDDS